MGSTLATLVFRPPEASYGSDPNLIWLSTTAGQVIPAFFLDRQASFTLLFSHGNAEDLGSEGVVKKMRELSSVLNVNIFAYEYTGYGMSSGDPSEEAVYADIEAAYKYLTGIIGIPSDQIIVYGWSLGSGPSVHLAAKAPVRGLVLQSPLSSVIRVGMPTQVTWPGDMFTNVDKIREVVCPIFIMHGTEDDTIPVWHSEELAEACRKECLYDMLYVEGAGHCDIEMKGRQIYIDKFKDFLEWLDDDECLSPLMTARSNLEDEKRLRSAAIRALASLSAGGVGKDPIPVWEEISKSLKTPSSTPRPTPRSARRSPPASSRRHHLGAIAETTIKLPEGGNGSPTAATTCASELASTPLAAPPVLLAARAA